MLFLLVNAHSGAFFGCPAPPREELRRADTVLVEICIPLLYIISMETAQTNHSPEFQELWAGLQDIRQILKETAESQKEAAARQKENDEKWEKHQRENERQTKEFNERFGFITNRFGEVLEHMVAPNMRDKFEEIGLNFPKANFPSIIKDYDNNIFLEIDIMLENGDKAMLVEVKSKLTIKDVKDHDKRIKKMRVYADLHGDRRGFLGAVAAVVIPSNVKEYALGQGFYVVEPSGETFNITQPYGQPEEWIKC